VFSAGSPFRQSLAANGMFRRPGEFATPIAPQATPDPNAPFDTSGMPFQYRMVFASPLDQAKWALAVAIVYVLVATWWNSQYIRYALRAKPLKRSANPDLYNLVENLAMSAGLPCPAIEVVASTRLNAYASGLTPASARIGLTTGLIERLSAREIEAVVAQELTHILNRDSRLMAVTKSCLDLVVLKYLRYFEQIWREPLRLLPIGVMLFMGVIQPLIYLALLLFAVGAALMAFLAKALVMQSREFVADAGAVELTKSPEALISALYKISGDQFVAEGQHFAQAMMLAGPTSGWLASHPTLEERVAALRRFGGVTAETEIAFAPFAEAPAEGQRVRRVAGLPGFDPSRLPVTEVAAAPRFGRRSADPGASLGFRDAAPRGSFGQRPTPVLGQDAQTRSASPREEISWVAVSAAEKENEGEFGDSWFEQWVMSGRLNRLVGKARSVQKKGQRGLIYVYAGIMVLGFVLTGLPRMFDEHAAAPPKGTDRFHADAFTSRPVSKNDP
jgi:heat shock protein HtpX